MKYQFPRIAIQYQNKTNESDVLEAAMKGKSIVYLSLVWQMSLICLFCDLKIIWVEGLDKNVYMNKKVTFRVKMYS